MTNVTFRGLDKSGEDLLLWNLRGKNKQNKGDSARSFVCFPRNLSWVRDLGSGQRSFTYFEYVCISFVFTLAEKGREERETRVR